MVIKIEDIRWRCPYIDHICVLCIFYGDHLSCDFKWTLCRMQNDDPQTYEDHHSKFNDNRNYYSWKLCCCGGGASNI